MGSFLRAERRAGQKLGQAQQRDQILAEEFLDQTEFMRSLRLEMRRSERSKKPFVLVLLRAIEASLADGDPFAPRGANSVHSKVRAALVPITRETDLKGWYQEGRSIGIILTEVGDNPAQEVGELLLSRLEDALSDPLTAEQLSQIRMTVHVYPQPWDGTSTGGTSEHFLQSLLEAPPQRRQRASQIVKRALDIVSALLLLALISPVFLLIAAIVKMTSKGPVLFRQTRVGLDGETFTFLKFRSMAVANDHSIHQEYVKSLIAGKAVKEVSRKGEGVYKLTRDPRVTPIGKFLRRTSLDELPQLLNVLKGDMSLVGPRPPIPYEVQCYERWHLRRLSAAKPGITGLWQVNGRSRTTFDEMVRMDIRYGKAWSLALDLKILLKTPLAVVKGNGAH